MSAPATERNQYMPIPVDRDVAVTALAIIETHPERHNQEEWRTDSGHPIEDFPDDPLNEECDTAGCLAGWVAFLDRVKWATKHPWMHYGDQVADPDRCTCPPESRFCICGNHMRVATYAQERLGLSAVEADSLFGPENTVDDLRAGIKALVNGEDVDVAVHESHLEHENTKCDDCFPYDNDDGDE
jgi:hypothetical protein